MGRRGLTRESRPPNSPSRPSRWTCRISALATPRAGAAARPPAPTSRACYPGEEFIVCVTVTVRVPLLPEFIDTNTATGYFVVERDRYAA